MKVLGIDPGLQVCGYGCLQVNGDGGQKVIEAGVFRTAGEKAIEIRLNQIAEDLTAVLKKFAPDVVAVEQLYSHYAHPKTSVLMGHARGVILQKCAEFGVEVRSFNATRIKKSITGSGRASKQQMQAAVQSLLSLPDVPEPDDVADAIAAAVCCANEVNILLSADNSKIR